MTASPALAVFVSGIALIGEPEVPAWFAIASLLCSPPEACNDIVFFPHLAARHPHAALISVARSRRESTSVNSRQSFSGGIIVPV